jgi:ribosomal protein L35
MQNSHFMTNGEIILTNDPKIKTKNGPDKRWTLALSTKFMSINQKKCNPLAHNYKKCRIFAFQVRTKKIVNADSDL